MANSLSVAGNTRISWSLSDADAQPQVSMSAQRSSARAITNGTGPNQATVAFTTALTITGVGSSTINVNAAPVTSFGFAGKAVFTQIREMLVSVPTGPTGGWVLFSAPTGTTGATGVAVRVGGQLHLVDYLTGISTATGAWTFQNGPTGTYGIDFTAIGLGSYAD